MFIGYVFNDSLTPPVSDGNNRKISALMNTVWWRQTEEIITEMVSSEVETRKMEVVPKTSTLLFSLFLLPFLFVALRPRRNRFHLLLVSVKNCDAKTVARASITVSFFFPPLISQPHLCYKL
jgi:hypothetical protein